MGVVAERRLVEFAPPEALGAELRRQAIVRWLDDGAAREGRTDAPAAVYFSEGDLR